MSGSRKKGGPVTDLVWAIVFISVIIGLLSKGNFTGVINDPLGWAQIKSDQLAQCVGGNGCEDFLHLSGFEEKDINLPNMKNKDLPKFNGKNLPKFDGKNLPKLENKDLPKFNEPNLGDTLQVPEMKELLGGLTVAESKKVDYDRNEWKHWIPTENKCWNTREEVLYRDAVEGSTTLLDKNKKETTDKSQACYITDGKWIDVYSGQEINSPRQIDIDHIIPLSYVAQHGGQEWTADEKMKYANDPEVLLAVSARENRSKGDKGPGEYMPSDKSYWCSYSKQYIHVADKYTISITAKDKKTLNEGLKTCE